MFHDAHSMLHGRQGMRCAYAPAVAMAGFVQMGFALAFSFKHIREEVVPVLQSLLGKHLPPHKEEAILSIIGIALTPGYHRRYRNCSVELWIG